MKQAAKESEGTHLEHVKEKGGGGQGDREQHGRQRADIGFSVVIAADAGTGRHGQDLLSRGDRCSHSGMIEHRHSDRDVRLPSASLTAHSNHASRKAKRRLSRSAVQCSTPLHFAFRLSAAPGTCARSPCCMDQHGRAAACPTARVCPHATDGLPISPMDTAFRRTEGLDGQIRVASSPYTSQWEVHGRVLIHVPRPHITSQIPQPTHRANEMHLCASSTMHHAFLDG